MRKFLVLLSAGCVLWSVGCAKPIGASNQAEVEPDYAPGFFDEKSEDATQDDTEGGETNTDLPHPDDVEETIQQKGSISTLLSFPQTQWNECGANPSGQYLEYTCVQTRKISVILDAFLQQRLLKCVDAGMAAQSGGGTAKAIHVVHAGIAGDPRHSPRSLHAHNRAVDVKVIRAVLTNGTERQYTYSKLGNRTFYTALRNCWGETVSTYNGCPLYRNTKMLTGSIGWENSAHGHHMHLSVPYCHSGRYGSDVWVR